MVKRRKAGAGSARGASSDYAEGATFEVVVQGVDIIITLPKAKFRAVYYKPAGQPQLILRERTQTDDYEVLAKAWQRAPQHGASRSVDKPQAYASPQQDQVADHAARAAVPQHVRTY
jgi:hypothetical protein